MDNQEQALAWLNSKVHQGNVYMSLESAVESLHARTGIFGTSCYQAAKIALYSCAAENDMDIASPNAHPTGKGFVRPKYIKALSTKLLEQSFRTSVCPVYSVSPLTGQPLRSFLAMSKTGLVFAMPAPRANGSLSNKERYNVNITWAVPRLVRSSVLQAFAEQHLDVLHVVHSGHVVVAGSYCEVGKLSKIARMAYEFLDHELQVLSCAENLCQIQSAVEFLSQRNTKTITQVWPAQKTAMMAALDAHEKLSAEADRVFVPDQQFHSALLRWAGVLFEEAPWTLQLHHVRSLHECGHISSEEVNAFIQKHGSGISSNDRPM